MNTQRLEILKQTVLSNAKHFNMQEGIAVVDEDTDQHDAIYGIDDFQHYGKPEIREINGVKTLVGNCNTTCCFGGFTALLFSPRLEELDSWDRMETEAARLLELTSEQANELFNRPVSKERDTNTSNDRERFNSAEEYAQAAAQRIDELIEKWSKENQEPVQLGI